MNKKFWFWIISFLLVSPLAGGEQSLSLEQAISLALRQNPIILAAEKELAVSLGQRMQMEALREPEIVLSAEGISFSRNQGQEGAELTFGLQQSFEFPGKRSLRSKIGRYSEEISRWELEKTRLVVRVKVNKAYYKVVLSSRTVDVYQASLGLIDRFIENATSRYQAGTINYLDVLRARVEKARIQNEWIAANKVLKEDRAELNLLLGKKGNEPLFLTTDISFTPFTQDLPGIQEEAMRTRPSLRIARLRLEQAAADMKLARMASLPDFSVGLFFPSLRFGAWGVGVGITAPLWRKQLKGQNVETEARREIEGVSREASERRIMAQIETAYANVKAAEAQVRLFEGTLLREIEDQIQISLLGYQHGKIDALNLLDIFRTYTETKGEYLKSLYLFLCGLAELEAAGEEYE